MFWFWSIGYHHKLSHSHIHFPFQSTRWSQYVRQDFICLDERVKYDIDYLNLMQLLTDIGWGMNSGTSVVVTVVWSPFPVTNGVKIRMCLSSHPKGYATYGWPFCQSVQRLGSNCQHSQDRGDLSTCTRWAIHRAGHIHWRSWQHYGKQCYHRWQDQSPHFMCKFFFWKIDKKSVEQTWSLLWDQITGV